MRTSPDCLSCFAEQASYSAGLATGNQSLRDKIDEEAARLIAGFDMQLSPPENAVFLYRMIAEASSRRDIFAGLKRVSNKTALKIIPDLKIKIEQAADPLRETILLAIAGNIIDYGAHHDFDIHYTIEKCLAAKPAIDDFDSLRKDLQKAQKVLYLGDNCGEIAFDRLLIERLHKDVTFAVKEKPVINDALESDAETCGLDKLCRIVSNGTECPGTPIDECSEEFKKIFNEADLIISKGQGNFETLSEVSAPIYFLMMVKCGVVAGHIEKVAAGPPKQIKPGDMILMKKQ